MKTKLPSKFLGENIYYVVSAPEYPFSNPGLKQYRGETILPKCFTKKSIQNTKMDSFHGGECEIIARRIHPKFGPVFLIMTKENPIDEAGAICSEIKWDESEDSKGRTRKSKVKLIELEFVNASCNPRSFIVIVNNPIFNLAAKTCYIGGSTPADIDIYEAQHFGGNIWTPPFARSLFPEFSFEIEKLPKYPDFSYLNQMNKRRLTKIEKSIYNTLYDNYCILTYQHKYARRLFKAGLG